MRSVWVLFFCIISALSTSVAAAQEAPSSDTARAEASVANGRELFSGRNFALAAAAFQRATLLDDQNAVAWAGLGAANLARRAWASVRDAYQRALALRPEHPELHLGYGRALLGLGDRPGATSAFERALELQPENAAASGELAALTSQGAENTLALCADGRDNDGNGAADCADAGCAALRICAEAAPENTAAACRDGADNDADGHPDCADQDCWPFSFCAASQRGVVQAAAEPAPRRTDYQAFRDGDPGASEDRGSHPTLTVGGVLLAFGLAGLTAGVGLIVGGENQGRYGDGGMISAGFWTTAISGTVTLPGMILAIVGGVLSNRRRGPRELSEVRVDVGAGGLELTF